MDNVKSTLDNTVFEHDECKSVMQELVGKWLTNSKSNGKAIGLVGPPGVGKTLIAKALGDALQIPFVQINLGGMDDRCILSGHSYTYSAAQPGLIVRKMIEAGKSRCVMYFDELDKFSRTVLAMLYDQDTHKSLNGSVTEWKLHSKNLWRPETTGSVKVEKEQLYNYITQITLIVEYSIIYSTYY